ncbi:MAG TPA: NAD(P)-dependent oxidoreductase, partial [Solirubrobacteraceae bacterium]|nr:NAD(P)-dependent oxidoreductase [Solirubrobacteraceae bacterium]
MASPSPSATVAFLGTGTMGLPMARNLLRAGFVVRAWNRTREKALALTDDGAEVTATPAEAAAGADVIVTMLADAAAVAAVADGEAAGFLGAADQDAVWAQMSTVGLEGIERCQQLAERSRIALVDAPVLGTKGPAEQGELTVLAAGEPPALARCRPIFEVLGSRILELGPVGAGTRLKLVINHWLVVLVEALAETIALAEALGVDPRRFLDTIKGGGLDTAYAQLKGNAILERRLEASFSLKMARKDAGLVVEAARRQGMDAALARVVAERMQRAIELGHGDEDMAATYWASVEPAERGSSTERGS